jgi:hypothetical protein
MTRFTNMMTKKMTMKMSAGMTRAPSRPRHVSPCPIESNQRKSV